MNYIKLFTAVFALASLVAGATTLLVWMITIHVNAIILVLAFPVIVAGVITLVAIIVDWLL